MVNGLLSKIVIDEQVHINKSGDGLSNLKLKLLQESKGQFQAELAKFLRNFQTKKRVDSDL